MEEKKQPETIDAYIASFSTDIQAALNQMRRTIREAAPQAGEKISWGMATFTLHGNLVHFAGQKNHVGFYPGPDAVEAFEKQLAPYKHSKGAVQFPYSQPLPLALIHDMVVFRVAQQQAPQAHTN